MGQCSTLPTEGRSATSTKGENVPFQYEESSQSRNEQFEQMMNDNGHLQERNPEVNRGESDQMEEDNPRDGIPQPPDVATRTRCYKLNLDAEINPQSHAYLGPFTDVPPPLTFSTSDDSSAKMNQTQIAIRTAKIFRGIKISTDGTILSQNARASRSNKGSKNKKGEKSRQASKIEKANDLVEESMLTGKAPDSDDPANMVSLVVMGEYDDMKYLVRDGSKKLRDASELPDDSLLAVNHPRGDGMDLRSPRKRLSPDQHGGIYAPSKLRSGLPQSSPRTPRDRPTPRSLDSTGVQADPAQSPHQSVNATGEADWSKALSLKGFNSIWNCGGAREDTGTASPTLILSPREGKPQSMGGFAASHQSRPVFEGRDSNYRQTRENGFTSRV